MFEKNEAFKFWENEFGTKDYGYDFSGKKIKKDAYNKPNEVGWIITYIKPVELGGDNNLGNLIIMHHKTNEEKELNYPDFSIMGKKYTVHYDEKGDFYYIEKIDINEDGGFI